MSYGTFKCFAFSRKLTLLLTVFMCILTVTAVRSGAESLPVTLCLDLMPCWHTYLKLIHNNLRLLPLRKYITVMILFSFILCFTLKIYSGILKCRTSTTDGSQVTQKPHLLLNCSMVLEAFSFDLS